MYPEPGRGRRKSFAGRVFVVNAEAMRVTFDRLADHEWAQVFIERDDGVVYRMHAGPVTAEIPHDLVHFTVEDALGVADGIWGAIAGGVVFRSMTHVSGRRPPHAAEQSATMIRERRDDLQRAELLGGFIERMADEPDSADVRTVTAAFGSRLSPMPDPAAISRAVTALRMAQQRWRAMPVGGRMVLEWPAHRRMSAPARRRPAGRSRTGRR